jgi:hypothetical protein
MRRILLIVLAGTMALAVAPGVALAGHHHRGKHKSHRHARVERFGSDTSTSGNSSSTSSDTAGKVSSFSGGVLTIQLNDGSMVSGRVDNSTEIECQAPENRETSHEDGGRGDDNSGDGDHNGGGDDQAQGDQNEANETNDANDANEANENEANQNDANENEANENEGNEDQGQPACDSSALTMNTVVREADLRLTGSGATWKKVELQK